MYGLARRYGPGFFKGPIGRKLLPPPVLAHIAEQYHRHGTYGIFLSRLLPVWRGIVPPFAGLAGLSPGRTLIPLALASGLWYAALTYAVSTVGANLDDVARLLGHINAALAVAAGAAALLVAIAIARRLRR